MPKIVVQTTVKATTKAPAAAKTGRQRAASHSSIGNSSALGTTVSQGWGGREMMIPVIPANSASAAPPSMSSLRGGGSRRAAAAPITRGASDMMPRASDANQCHQVVRIGAVGVADSLYTRAPPTPEIIVAPPAATRKPATGRSLLSVKLVPK